MVVDSPPAGQSCITSARIIQRHKPADRILWQGVKREALQGNIASFVITHQDIAACTDHPDAYGRRTMLSVITGTDLRTHSYEALRGVLHPAPRLERSTPGLPPQLYSTVSSLLAISPAYNHFSNLQVFPSSITIRSS